MPRGPCDFKVNNIKRARRAAELAGMHDATIEIDPRSGVIRIIPRDNKTADPCLGSLAPGQS